MPAKKKAASSGAAESMEALIGPLLAVSPELRDDAVGLLREVLAEYRRTLRYGDAQSKVGLLKAIAPALFRASASTGADEGMGKMRNEFDSMRAELRAALSPQPKKAPAKQKTPIRADQPKVRVTKPKRAGAS